MTEQQNLLVYYIFYILSQTCGKGQYNLSTSFQTFNGQRRLFMHNNMNGISAFTVWGQEMHMELVFTDTWENVLANCLLNALQI